VYEWNVPATRTNRLDNPLRKLRLILGTDSHPMHQEVFAARIGVPVTTLRSIEGGRRPMTTENCLSAIAISLLAFWNVTHAEWRVLGTDVRYEKKHADLAELFDPEDPYLDDLYAHKLIERVLHMIRGCRTRRQRRGLLLYLSEHLRNTAERFGLNTKLELTEPLWVHAIYPVVWGKPLPKDDVFMAGFKDKDSAWSHPSPHQDVDGIFDFRSKRTFRAEEYPAKTAAEHDRIVAERRRVRAEKLTKPEKDSGPILDPKSKRSGNVKRQVT
jgi:hypothetical protein